MEKEMGIKEIEDKLAGMGDFLKLEFLENMLKRLSSFQTKKWIHLKLYHLYEARSMFREAGKNVEAAIQITVPIMEKIELAKKWAELFIKAGDYIKVDQIIKTVYSIGNARDGILFKSHVKTLYIGQAKEYEKQKKRNNALKIYEKLLGLDLSEGEKEEVKAHLLELYNTLGKVREYFALKGGK